MVSRRKRANDTIMGRIDQIDSRVSRTEKSPRDAHVREDSITDGLIASDAVSTDTIKTNAVTSDKIAPGAVTTNELGVVNNIVSDSDLMLNLPENNTLTLNGQQYAPPPPSDVYPLYLNERQQVVTGLGELRIATLQDNYTAGNPVAQINGTGVLVTVLSWAVGYTPVSNDVVLIGRTGAGWTIIQRVVTQIAYPLFLNLPLSNGWVNFGSPWKGAQFTKTATGVVKVSGMIKSGASASGTVIGTLPIGFRPPKIMSFPAQDTSNPRSVDVYPDGTIRTGPLVTGVEWISLSNITFTTTLTYTEIQYFGGTWSNQMADYETAGYGIDQYGMIWFKGSVRNTTAATGSLLNHDPIYTALSAQYSHLIGQTNGGFASYAIGDSSGRGPGSVVGYKKGTPLTNFSMNGNFIASESAIAGYTPLSFINGWTNYTGDFAKAGYYKRPDGLVSLRGLLSSGTMNAPIAVLPVGHRPGARLLLSAVSSNDLGRVDIHPTGEIHAVRGTNVLLSLDGLSFVAEQ